MSVHGNASPRAVSIAAFTASEMLAIGTNARLFNSCEKLSESRVTRKIGTQCQRINEKTDYTVKLTLISAVNGRSNDNVVLARIAMQ